MDQRRAPYQRGAPHRAITRQFLSPFIPLPLNNLLTLALGTAFNYLKKTREDCFCQ